MQSADPIVTSDDTVMADAHPNIALLKRLDMANLENAADLFTDDFVFHFFNPKLPDLAGDYVGVSGMQTFLGKMVALTEGTFHVELITVTPVGNELIVMHNRNHMTLQGTPIETEVVVVWRVVGGRFAEVWDIPSVYGV